MTQAVEERERTGAETFPANRDEYVARHGNERPRALLGKKLASWGARHLPSARLRRRCLRAMGISLPTPDPGERAVGFQREVWRRIGEQPPRYILLTSNRSSLARSRSYDPFLEDKLRELLRTGYRLEADGG